MSTVLNLEGKLQTIADRIVPSDLCAWTFGALFREKDGSVHQAWASAGELPAGRPENTTVSVVVSGWVLPLISSLRRCWQVTLTPDTTLHVYSCVKIFVSIAIMQLVERGVIGLDDSIMDILCVLIRPLVLHGSPRRSRGPFRSCGLTQFCYQSFSQQTRYDCTRSRRRGRIDATTDRCSHPAAPSDTHCRSCVSSTTVTQSQPR